MSLFNGSSVFNDLSAAKFGPVANCIWDASISGFRPQTTSDSAGVSTFTTPSNFITSGAQPSGQSNGTALNANSARKMLYIQNIGINPLYIKFGSGASNSSVNVILGGGSTSGDGFGGTFVDDQGKIVGLVSVSGIQSSYIIWDA